MTPDGGVLHTNAAMCARAVSDALDAAQLPRSALSMLAAATPQGNYLVPGHAAAVRAELGAGALEIASSERVRLIGDGGEGGVAFGALKRRQAEGLPLDPRAATHM